MVPKIPRPPKSFYLALVLEVSPAAPASVAQLTYLVSEELPPLRLHLQTLPDEVLFDILCRNANGGHVGIEACWIGLESLVSQQKNNRVNCGMWLLKDVSINEARKTRDGSHEVVIHMVVNFVGWRAMKMIVLMMTASLLVI
jgi:hypothetical protein